MGVYHTFNLIIHSFGNHFQGNAKGIADNKPLHEAMLRLSAQII